MHGTLDYALCAQHLTYAEIRLLGLLPEGFLRQARSFAVVRDPYSRILSSVLHFRAQVFLRIGLPELKSEEDLTKAIDVWLNLELEDHNFLAHRRPQSDFITDLDGRIVVQDLLRFERLADEYYGLCQRLDLASPPLRKIGGRKVDKAGLPPLSQDARALVVEAFRRDFDILGYPT
ncbi:hypothetical protein MALG_02562 [Marinovum algicola DG 898]|nr:hypothetical protein MALG_02562 [Marinovum algicola DG 898]